MLLSALSTSEQITISNEKLKILAQAANISSLECNALLQILKDHQLIDISSKGTVGILGLTTETTLTHTSNIFYGQKPKNSEIAAIAISEEISSAPRDRNIVLEKMADEHHLDFATLNAFRNNIEEMGLVDVEKIDDSKTLYFNGNLFKRKDAGKIEKVLGTLTLEEQRRLIAFNQLLDETVCIDRETAINRLGSKLFAKLSSIGMYDVSVVSNENGETGYLTKPSSFSKFSSSGIEDAFDLAKAFVSSLTYGMTRSSSTRGQISMVPQLLGALIRGEQIGPVQAIAQDYRILELKHVVEIKEGSKTNFNGNLRRGWMMRLLKKDVGILALEAMQKGNISEQSLDSLPGAIINRYQGPEINRTITRKKMNNTAPKDTNDMIMALRTGKF